MGSPKKLLLCQMVLGPSAWNVYVVRRLTKRREFGECDDWRRNIAIAGCIRDPGEFLNTFLHECIEAVNASGDLKLKHTQIQVIARDLAAMLLPYVPRAIWRKVFAVLRQFESEFEEDGEGTEKNRSDNDVARQAGKAHKGKRKRADGP